MIYSEEHLKQSKTIIVLCDLVLRQVRGWVKDNEDCCLEDMNGCCGIASYTLYRVLRKAGYKASIASVTNCCEGHCWVELDNNVIDLTATQFDKSLSEIFITNKKDYYKNDVPRFYRNQEKLKFKKYKETLKYIKEWDKQSPQIYLSNIQKLLKTIKVLKIKQ